MAKVNILDSFEFKEDIEKLHEIVESNSFCFEVNGELYLQINTYGSKDRKFKNKCSQTIQVKINDLIDLQKILLNKKI